MKLKVTPIDPTFNFITDLHPIIPAREAPPKWWKTIKREGVNEDLRSAGNIKTCPAIKDIINYGYIMPSWSWMQFIEEDGEVYWSMGHPGVGIESHAQQQIEGAPVEPLPLGGVFKLVSPWQFETPPGWAVIFNDPFWHDEDRPIKFLSGLVRTDAFNGINFPFEMNRPLEKNEVLQVTAGTPLIHMSVVPIDDTFELEVNEATQKSTDNYIRQQQSVQATHTNHYNHTVKNFDKNRKS
jgi:hypothetical protein